jgi:hypothetical protein
MSMLVPGTIRSACAIVPTREEDRSISASEAEALAEFARTNGLDQESIADVRRSYLTRLVAIALRETVRQ